MVSSSKKQKTNASQRSQGTSMESNPLNLTKLLANDNQHKVFEEHFHCIPIFTPKFGKIGNFEHDDFLFPYLLRQQNLFDFCCETNDIYHELVRVFYCNMNFRKNRITSYVKGKEIVLDLNTFGLLCCNIPSKGNIVGFGLQCEWDNYDRKESYYSMCRISREEIELRKQQSVGETVKNRDILSAGHLKLEDRLLHYLLSYVILPKFSNHSQISDIELQLMYAIKMNIKINWIEMIMRQMWNVRGTQSHLPYAILITNFLQHFGVSTNGETKVSLNLCESKIDVEAVNKMEPSPRCPQPSEFHAQSSSSTAMPSNQMIMDELHSLRGYITNRMDALNTQNQQIQYELHCISSKLRSMEVDEDSSEPES
ncbi:unnamed protein product [Lupinus luteus]|uniref:Putative plant transposon protein domain-containing protein n=1 Tax=Lupinus luteus TaxID=3873 RepID=A0AAV1WKJ8_LUPLU